MELPLVKPEDKHVAAAPTANGPKAVRHSGTSRTSCAASSVCRLRHCWGSELMHCEDRASVKHETMLPPSVKMLMAPVARQVATLPAAKAPRAVTQMGMAGIRARPEMDPRLWQGAGIGGQIGVGVGVAMQATSVDVAVPETKPSAISRHSMTPTPVLELVKAPVDRQVAAAPAAKGPRAAAQSGTSIRRSVRLVSDARLTQRLGKVVMQRPSRAVRMQLAMSEPAVDGVMEVARQVATLPTA
ncbi:hypothetical protein VTK73DRAFT_3983 [Phialemonium thermophilum]|uniref:Uncharacterized protein n=1 Tax=Phialemonium thermophilum TaxID=223376 RepID=A0ABR3VD91_9PEZI